MEFHKYHSLENTYREKSVDYALRNFPKDSEWVITEKLDGANFAFYFDGANHKQASRNQFIEPSNFNSSSAIVDSNLNKIEKLYQLVNKDYPDHYIIVYGELFGKGILNRVNYGEKSFRAFDICIVDKEGLINFIPYSLFARYCDEVSIPRLESLYVGSLFGCLKYKNDSDSTILGIENNTMEGVVIKGFDQDYYNQFDQRIVFKNKNEKFSEKSKKPKTKASPVKVQNSDKIEEYITVNRVHSLLSKEGGLESINPKDFGRLIGAYSKDVIQDLIADEIIPADYRKNEEYKSLGKFITNISKPLLVSEILHKI